MIKISTSKADSSTNDVLDWVYYFGGGCVRVNDYNFSKTVKKSIGQEQLLPQLYDWYRRGYFHVFPNRKVLSISGAEEFVNAELNTINKFLEGRLFDSKSINKPSDNFQNKLINLFLSKSVGIKIPETIVSNDVEFIRDFLYRAKTAIMKPVTEAKFNVVDSEEKEINIFVKYDALTPENLAGFKQNAVPAVFQQYIEKRYELRIFYLNGAFYPMAIFSQANEKTKIDFRNYDNERPNRCVPYKLPKDIEEKLDKFMKAADLNCGSIDMIYTPEGEYVFLEVNPVGQFQWLSKHCNYDIERLIAQTLMQNDGRRENTPRN